MYATCSEVTAIASSFHIVKQDTALANFDGVATPFDVTDEAANAVAIPPPLNG